MSEISAEELAQWLESYADGMLQWNLPDIVYKQATIPMLEAAACLRALAEDAERLELAKAALVNIANHDDLLEANPESFASLAANRMQKQAQFAIDAIDKARHD